MITPERIAEMWHEEIMSFKLTVYGVPQPAGSKRAFIPKNGTRPVVTDANPGARDWKNTIAKEALAAMNGSGLMEGPLFAHFIFVLSRPKSHYGTGRNARQLKPLFVHAMPIGRPDTTKLIRGAEDALLKIVYFDDSQIVKQMGNKVYGDPPRVEIVIQHYVP